MAATRLIFLSLFVCMFVITTHFVAANEGDVPLKRGPRQGFEKETPSDDEERTVDEEDDEDWEDEEEEDIEVPPIEAGQTLGTINWSTPDLSDDYHSPHLPGDMKCDACTILTFMMAERLDKANAKRPSLKKKLPESEIIDIFESLCNDEYKNVGVKEINGKKRLSGPGSKVQETPGIMQGGGKWPYRMLQMCQGYLGEFGEDELYEFYLKGTLKKKLCNGPKGVCRKKKDDGKKKEGKGKKKTTKGKGKKSKGGKKKSKSEL